MQEKLRGKIRFAVVEKTAAGPANRDISGLFLPVLFVQDGGGSGQAKTLEMRQALKVGSPSCTGMPNLPHLPAVETWRTGAGTLARFIRYSSSNSSRRKGTWQFLHLA